MDKEFFVRALAAEDWQDFRDIRLEALRLHPTVYGSRYERERSFTKSDWEGHLKNDSGRIFAGFCKDDLAGIAGIVTYSADQTGRTAILYTWYMRDAFRGAARFRQIVGGSLEWARAQGCYDSIIVSHRDGNDASRRVNQFFGFAHTHSVEETWSDGVTAQNHYYRLEI